MSRAGSSARRTAALVTIDDYAFADADISLADRPASGFRLGDPAPPATPPAHRPATLRAIGGRGDVLPVVVGFDDDAVASPRPGGALPADADALPIDGSWRWLGMLCCWLSSALIVSLMVLALN